MASKGKHGGTPEAVPGSDFGADFGNGDETARQAGLSAEADSIDSALNAQKMPGDDSAKASPAKTAGAAKFASKRSAFEIEDNVPMPDARRGSRESMYPFAKMAVGQRFFVPASEDAPEPWKNMPSICSRASRSLWPKQFESRRIDKPAGVGVWRVADDTASAPPPVRTRSKKS